MSRNSEHNAARYLKQLQHDFGVAAQQVKGSEFNRIGKLWLERFCPHVKLNTGKWVYQGFRWHAYSFGHEHALTGIPAFEAYIANEVEPFYAYFETNDVLFECTAESWPDLRPLNKDVYLFPRFMKWTFVTTHEVSLGLGPYFAERVA